jgi:hypothetical protein
LRIAIITRSDYRSPRILAESLKLQLLDVGVEADVLFKISVLTRLNSFDKSKEKIKFHFWLRKKIANFFKDQEFLKKLKAYDAVIISECCPNGFWRDLYHIEKLRTILNKPVLFYEVYYLGNAPTQIRSLKESGSALIERYSWHLSVANVTEVWIKEVAPWSCIGLDLTNTGLKPVAKKEFIAIVDFKQPGYEKYREEQIKVLDELEIKTIELCGNYTLEEIRSIYKQAAVFFIQFPEAFGLPIAECLASGAHIITPSSSWPMAWRLDDNPGVHLDGKLPNIFTTYSSTEDLKIKLVELREKYELDKTPFEIFDLFIKHYAHYYYGDKTKLKEVIEKIREGQIN